MKFAVAFSLAFASFFTVVTSQAGGSTDPKARASLHDSTVADRDGPQVWSEDDHLGAAPRRVRDLMTRRNLSKREELIKRSIVTDVLNGVGDIFKSGKLDLNGPLRQGTESLRGVTKVIDFNKVITAGFGDALSRNTQIQSIPFGTTVAGVATSLVSGFDFNTLITRDGVNFLQGAVSQVDANAVAESGIQAVLKAVAP